MSANVAQLKPPDPDDDTLIDTSIPHILVPPDEYTLTYVRHQKFLYMGRQPKCLVVFRIMDYGPHFERRVPCFYRVRKFTKDGRLVAGPRSRLVRDLQSCGIVSKRQDRLGVGWLGGLLVKGKVSTVSKDGDGDSLCEASQYSVVVKLLGAAP